MFTFLRYISVNKQLLFFFVWYVKTSLRSFGKALSLGPRLWWLRWLEPHAARRLPCRQNCACIAIRFFPHSAFLPAHVHFDCFRFQRAIQWKAREQGVKAPASVAFFPQKKDGFQNVLVQDDREPQPRLGLLYREASMVSHSWQRGGHVSIGGAYILVTYRT